MTSMRRRSGRYKSPPPLGSDSDPPGVRETSEITSRQDEYKAGHLVWVKLKQQPWWPAKVVENKCTEETVEGCPCQSVVVQRFGEDDCIETTSPKCLCHYNSPMRENYKEQGLKWRMTKDRKDLFQEALKLCDIELMSLSDDSSSNNEPLITLPSSHQKADPKSNLPDPKNNLPGNNSPDSQQTADPKNNSPDSQMTADPKNNSPDNEQSETKNNSPDSQLTTDPQNTPPDNQQVTDSQSLSPDSQQPDNPQESDIPPSSFDVPVEVNDSLSEFTNGAVVWIKMSNLPWWPAQVDEVKPVMGNRPVITVAFFNEDTVEDIKDLKRIKPFLCPEREKFATKGMQSTYKGRAVLFGEAYKLALDTFNMVDKTELKQSLNNDNFLNSTGKDQRVIQLPCVHENIDTKSKKLALMMEQMRKKKSKSGKRSIKQGNSGSLMERKGHKKPRKGQVKTDVSKLRMKRKKKERLEIDEEMEEELYREEKAGYTEDTGYTESSSPIPYSDNSIKDVPSSDYSLHVKEKIQSPDFTGISNSLPISTQNSDLCCSKTNISRKSKKRRKMSDSEENDESLEESLPALYNRTALKKGSRPKSSKRTKATKKNRQKVNRKGSEEVNSNKKSRNDFDPVYKEASSPIPYNRTEDSGKLSDHEGSGGSLSEVPLYPSTPTGAPSGQGTGRINCCPESKDLIRSTQDTNDREGFDPNLDVDDCSDDEDLPDGLTPSRQEAIEENDIVWVKWKGCPVWPAIVKRLHRKKKRILKVSLLVIEPHHYIPKRFCMNYRPKSVLPYNSRDSDLFMEQGSSLEGDGGIRFNRAVDLIQNYLTKKILGTLRKEDMEFMQCQGEIPEVFEKSQSPSPSPVTDLVDLPASPLSSDGEKEESVVCIGEEGPTNDPEINKRYEKIKEKNASLVEFLKTNEVKQYLLDILREKKKSEKHTTYMCGRSKARDALKNPGFGPIADEDQQEDVLFTMVGWYKQETKLPEKEIPDVNYVLDVWIPEGIVYGLIKLRKYSRKKAWEQFEKGVYMTKREKAEIHQSILDSAKRVSAEDIQRYEENLQRRMELICQQSGLQNLPFDSYQ